MRPRSNGLITLAAVAVTLLGTCPAAAGAVRPDLLVRRLTKPPGSARRGQQFSVKATVANRGKAKAKASTLGFLLSRDARADVRDLALAAKKVRRIAAGKAAKVTARLTVPALAGTGRWEVLAC